MTLIICIYFIKYKGFQHFILLELCQEKKDHITGDCVSTTYNCLRHELGASFNNISVFP